MPASKQISIEAVSEKDGTGKNGKPYTRFGIKDQDGEWYTTFQKAVGNLAKEHKGTGAMFNVSYDTNDYGADITELAGPVANGDTPTPESRKAPAKDEVDWDGKDRRMVRTAIWKSYLEGRVPGFFSAMKTWPQNPNPVEAADFVFEMGTHLLAQIENDIYRGFSDTDAPLGKTPTDDDDLPF